MADQQSQSPGVTGVTETNASHPIYDEISQGPLGAVLRERGSD